MNQGGSSPHYSAQKQPRNQQTHSDEVLQRAHEAVRYIAAFDLDRAHEANNAGFSKSDTKLGNCLAKWPTEIVVRHWAFALIAVRLARKYRRQLPPRLLVDQPVQVKRSI